MCTKSARFSWLLKYFTFSAQLFDGMTRTAGSKAWTPVEIHLLAVAWHSVVESKTTSLSEVQTTMGKQFTAALDAISIPSHPLHSHFNDPVAKVWLADLQGPDGVTNRRSPAGCYNQYQKNLTYMRNTLDVFWSREVTDTTIQQSGFNIDDVKKKVLVMAWLKNRIDTLKKKARAGDPAVIQGTLMDSQEEQELDPVSGLHGVSDENKTFGLDSSDIVACGGTAATFKEINITTAEALFMNCSTALDTDWQPPEWRAWWAHGPPAELRQKMDPSDTSVFIYPHMSVAASSTQRMKDDGTIQSRDSKKKSKKRRTSDVDTKRELHDIRGLLAMQLANTLASRGPHRSDVESKTLQAALESTASFLRRADDANHDDDSDDDNDERGGTEAEASSPTRAQVLSCSSEMRNLRN